MASGSGALRSTLSNSINCDSGVRWPAAGSTSMIAVTDCASFAGLLAGSTLGSPSFADVLTVSTLAISWRPTASCSHCGTKRTSTLISVQGPQVTGIGVTTSSQGTSGVTVPVHE